MDIKHRLWQGWLANKIYIPPSSSGKDGYIVIRNNKEIFVSNRIIEKAISYTEKFRLGFIKDDVLWALSSDLTDNIRTEEFQNILSILIKNKLV